MAKQGTPRGRPPLGAILVQGRWQLTEESLNRAAVRLETHRTQCRERYRRNRAALAQKRPDMFKYRQKPWMQEWQTTLTLDEAEQAPSIAEP